jgi:hypothetical protein
MLIVVPPVGYQDDDLTKKWQVDEKFVNLLFRQLAKIST